MNEGATCEVEVMFEKQFMYMSWSSFFKQARDTCLKSCTKFNCKQVI